MIEVLNDYVIYGVIGLMLITATISRRGYYWQDHQAIVLRPWRDGVICVICLALAYATGHVETAKAKSSQLVEIGSSNEAAKDINWLDRQFVGTWNMQAKESGKIFKNTATILIPIALLLFAGPLKRRAVLFFVFAQGYVMTMLLTGFTKGAVDRMRPFAYIDAEGVERLSADARKEWLEDFSDVDIYNSFFSGDASMTAYGLIFFATAYALCYPKIRSKWVVWIAAVLGVILGCVFRVLSGKHFPTDVIVGAAVGAGVAVALLYLHRGSARSNNSFKRSAAPEFE